ncbi:MAG: translation initiation factor IF-2 [Candidatus Paracaedimonas acanthamoebae]|uniref:Translation initiation factor IF-2 n=1 Tax=Candidatus Paracaedimonas acanthamoebae TaxID=244581 RepID=A0A8J7PQK5_9PROT|nr:translation initiation factor IF-2 [Candidatus Paracaedimonas acanthamoebae]
MTEQKDSNEKKTLTLGGKLSLKKTPESGQIRQSFSHGRSKSVAVEVRKKRTVEKAGGSEGEHYENSLKSGEKANSEFETRLKAVQNALKSAPDLEAKLSKERLLREEMEALRLVEIENQQKQEEERRQPQKVEETSEEIPSTTPPSLPVETSEQNVNASVRPKKSYEIDEGDEEGEHRNVKKSVAKPAVKKAENTEAKRHDFKQRLHGLSFEEALQADEEIGRGRHGSSRRPKFKKPKEIIETKFIVREVNIPEAISVQELANRMAIRAAEVVKKLISMGVLATVNQMIDADTAEIVVTEFGHICKRTTTEDIGNILMAQEEDPSTMVIRAPVVTVMGHVDHGKTSLLDAIRKTDVAAHEAGGITQHIGAYQVTMPSGKKITFIDTPGHAAFTEMRARGANVTDIVILVVAADDGIMAQTVEAIHHARAANVPIIVAINKIDKPDADANRVRTALLQHEIVLEEMGGDIIAIEVSAKTGLNIDKLEEAILLQAEVLNLKANPHRDALGAVIEAKLEKGRGAVATVLIQRGTLKVSDIFVAGTEWGRVRALVDDRGNNLKQASPSQPVEVIGFNGAPGAGDLFIVVESEAKAREIVDTRSQALKAHQAAALRKTTMDQLIQNAAAQGSMKELAVVIKSDVQGSLEAILGSIHKLATSEVSVRVLYSGVGGISESDVTLARASGGFVIGFNVRANQQARELAHRDGVELRYYSIIYDVIDDVKAILGGLLSPTLKENFLGNAEIRQVFNITKAGKIAGCYITEGTVKRGAKVRLLRDNVVIHEGSLKTLKRLKDEVKEVKQGFECGMAFENYQDIREGDVIECFEVESIARVLA